MKKVAIPIFLLTLLSGCEDGSSSASEKSQLEEELKVELDKLKIENEQLKNEISLIEEGLESEKEALRTTMNLALRIFSAMNNKDFEYITSISSSNVQVNEKGSEIIFREPNYAHNITNLPYLLENLEYRFYILEEDKITIGFANYFFEGHSTIYFNFIKQNDAWLFDYLVTDA